MAIETTRVDKWLYQTLSGDSILQSHVGDRIYNGLAPSSPTYPLILFNHQAGRDVIVVGAQRAMVATTYLLKAVDRSASNSSLEPIVDRFDRLLHGNSGVPATGFRVLACYREETVEYVEEEGGIPFRHLGGLYRILVQEES